MPHCYLDFLTLTLGSKHTYPTLIALVTECLFHTFHNILYSPLSLYPASINLYKSINGIVKKLESESSLLNLLLLGHNSPAISIFFSLDTAFYTALRCHSLTLRNSSCRIGTSEYRKDSGSRMYSNILKVTF